MNGPTPEIQPYVTDLSRDHQMLRQLVRDVASLLEKVDDPQNRTIALQRLMALLEFLREHFAAEEEAGALVESRHYCPAVCPEVDRILAEHARLLEMLEQTLRKLQGLSQLADEVARAVRNDFELFRRKMEDHENAEKAVIARAFGAIPD